MRTRTVLSLPLLGSLLVVNGLMSAEAADDQTQFTLKYQFKPGQRVAYMVDHQTQVHMQKGQAAQVVEHGSLTDKQYIVRAVDGDGNAELDLQIDRVRMSAGVDGADSVTYDSDSGEAPPTTLKGIAETVGKPHVNVKVSPSGRLLAINWLVGEDIASKPTIEDEADLDILVVLPSQPLAIGETWKQPLNATVSAGPKLRKSVKLQREYTLKSVAGNLATIQLKTTVITPLHDPTQEFQVMSKLLGGAIKFDLDRGVVVSRTLSVDRMVVGFEGADSKIHNISKRIETLADSRTAEAAAEGAVRK